jgi:hypothetical protein
MKISSQMFDAFKVIRLMDAAAHFGSVAATGHREKKRISKNKRVRGQNR